MKKLLLISILMMFVLLSCTKKETGRSEISADNSSAEKEVQTETNLPKVYVFVNAKNVLELRSSPNIESEKVLSLQHKEKLELIEDTGTKATIDGIESTWLNVKTESGVTGYVFGGYVEKDLKVINYYDKLIGRYILTSDDGEQGFFEFKFSGNGKVKFTTDNSFFNREETIDLYDVIKSNGVLYETAAEMGFASTSIKITYLSDTEEIAVYKHHHESVMDFSDDAEDPGVSKKIDKVSTEIYKKEI